MSLTIVCYISIQIVSYPSQIGAALTSLQHHIQTCKSWQSSGSGENSNVPFLCFQVRWHPPHMYAHQIAMAITQAFAWLTARQASSKYCICTPGNSHCWVSVYARLVTVVSLGAHYYFTPTGTGTFRYTATLTFLNVSVLKLLAFTPLDDGES